MILVTFTRSSNGYNAGETAGFPADKALSLIKGGAAVRANEEPPPP